MNIKTAVIALLIGFTGFGFAATAREMDEVRNKTELTSDDLNIIDSFISRTVRDMLESQTVKDSVRKREDILVRRPKDEPQEYREQFLESIKSNITWAKETVQTWDEPIFMEAMQINLAVIVGSLDDIELYDIAVEMSYQNHIAIKFWALRGLTGPRVTEYASENPGSQRTEAIIEAVNNAAQINAPAFIKMIVDFASRLGGNDGIEVLATVADTRIDAYMRRAAYNESIEAVILAAMAEKINADQAARTALAEKFAQLLSLSLQKCAVMLSPDGTIEVAAWSQMITLIAEVERTILPKFDISVEFAQALQGQDYELFMNEYNKIFGTEDEDGELITALAVDIDILSIEQN